MYRTVIFFSFIVRLCLHSSIREEGGWRPSMDSDKQNTLNGMITTSLP